MIPHVELLAIEIFGVRIRTFGTLVTLGIVVGHTVLVRRARALGLGPPRAIEAFAVLLVASAVGASLAASDALGSVAAFLGATAGAALFSRFAKIPLLALLDVGAYAFPFGWIFARLGCALVHDHLGVRSTSPLAVAFPSTPRYDLGVLEFLAMIPLVALAFVLGRRSAPSASGRLAAAIGGAYAVARFTLELARERLPGAPPLTPAQIVCLFAVGACAVLASRPSRREREHGADRDAR